MRSDPGAPRDWRGYWRGYWCGYGYALALGILILDQITKHLASAQLVYAVPRPVWFCFDLTLHHNQGAAFSLLSSAGGWQRWFFAVTALLVSAALLLWIPRLQRQQCSLALGLALVLGGALGNLLDRLRLGYVVDFISVHYGGWYFPTFNVADAAISVGAAFIVWDSLRGAPQGSAGD